MTGGAPHDESYAWQWECGWCGNIVPVPRGRQEGNEE